MFDPFKVRKTNRRIQRTASVIRPKGCFEPSHNVADKKQMEEWAKLLTANQIVAYIPSTGLETFSYFLILLSGTGSSTVLPTAFTRSEQARTVNFNSNQVLIYVTPGDETVTISYYIDTTGAQQLSVPQNSYYFVSEQFI